MRQADNSFRILIISLFLAIIIVIGKTVKAEMLKTFTLHAKTGYRGDSVNVDVVGCHNLHSFNKKVSSITFKDHDACIRLHDQFGCQGGHLDVVGELDTFCAEDLATCGFNDATSSVSGCDYGLDLTSTPMDRNGSEGHFVEDMTLTTRGEPCKSPCVMGKETHYFWCYTNLKRMSWDYCSPRMGVDYYGNLCSGPCATNGYSYSWCPCQKCKYASRRKGWRESWGYCSLSANN